MRGIKREGKGGKSRGRKAVSEGEFDEGKEEAGEECWESEGRRSDEGNMEVSRIWGGGGKARGRKRDEGYMRGRRMWEGEEKGKKMRGREAMSNEGKKKMGGNEAGRRKM